MSTAPARWLRASLAVAALAAAAGARAQQVPDSLKQGFEELKQRPRPAPAAGGLCAGEVSEPSAKGAWYHKIAAAPDETTVGITGKVVLPRVTTDAGRWLAKRDGDPSWWLGPLDRPSVYVGLSQAGLEIDAGLSWEQPLDAEGKPAVDSAGRPVFAFRPFWRVSTGGHSTFGPPPEHRRPSFAPGERVSLSLEVVGDGELVLALAGDGGNSYSEVFHAPDLPREAAGRPRLFKRVNAIDQYRMEGTTRRGNEGSDALPTRATALGSRWLSAGLLLPDGGVRPLAGEACRAAIGGDRAASLPPAVTVSQPTPAGGETVDIAPSR